MSRTKKSEIPHYEMLYIVPNKYSQSEADKIADQTKKTITKEKGEITYEENWGKKKLAYPIKHYKHGYYFLIEFDLDGAKLAKVDKSFRMSEEILRFQIVKKRKKTAAEIVAEQKIQEKITEKKVEKLEEAIEEKKEEEKAEKKQKEDKTKVDLKDLDEKLDKILDSDNLL